MWFLLALLIKDCSPWLVCKAKWPKAHCRDCLQGAQERRRRQALCPARGYLANREEGRGVPDSLSQFLYLYRNLKGVMTTHTTARLRQAWLCGVLGPQQNGL